MERGRGVFALSCPRGAGSRRQRRINPSLRAQPPLANKKPEESKKERERERERERVFRKETNKWWVDLVCGLSTQANRVWVHVCACMFVCCILSVWQWVLMDLCFEVRSSASPPKKQSVYVLICSQKPLWPWIQQQAWLNASAVHCGPLKPWEVERQNSFQLMLCYPRKVMASVARYQCRSRHAGQVWYC